MEFFVLVVFFAPLILLIVYFLKNKKTNEKNQSEINSLKNKLNELDYDSYETAKLKIKNIEENILQKELELKDLDTKYELQKQSKEEWLKKKLNQINEDVTLRQIDLSNTRNELNSLYEEKNKIEKNINTQTNKLKKLKILYKSTNYAIENFFNENILNTESLKLNKNDEIILDELAPTVTLQLHCMDVKSLKQAFNDNQKQIDKLLLQYSGRYTTKTNKSIYNLMTIALSAELQNVLYNLKFEKLDDCINQVKEITSKYLNIASEGNQSIIVTITKFIGQLENLYINAVKIEYNYYVKREQAKQEQLAIRQQMKEEAEERKLLELEKKKILNEEQKYNNEIARITDLKEKATNNEEIEKLKIQLLELQSKLSDIILKKEEISTLQNGKAGYVYVISNKGSFGDKVFKIGMTRRLDPQERVNELGSASVPFKFDVHSFIFSENAVNLETELHRRLNKQRVNKVNLRKEFFYSSVDELEKLVQTIDETAEFNKTMLAEEFNQSLSSENIYTSDLMEELLDLEEDE